MTKQLRTLLIATLMVGWTVAVIGCGGGAADEKQPKLSGPPDPRIKGPATPGGAGVDKGASKEATLP